MSKVKRIFVEKKPGFDIEAKGIYSDIKENLSIQNIKSVRVINRYDIEGIDDEIYLNSKNTIFSEPPVDFVYDEEFFSEKDEVCIPIEYLPGQYDQRADSAVQSIQLLTHGECPLVKTARIIVLKGDLKDSEINRIEKYLINPVDSRKALLEKPETLQDEIEIPNDIKNIDNFMSMNDKEIEDLMNEMGLAMSKEDLLFCQKYFTNEEKRNPTLTEIKVIDTYWSDHCRHTTFLTEIKDVNVKEGKYKEIIDETYSNYSKDRVNVYGERIKKKPVCLMDIGTLAMKKLRKQGKLNDLEISEEINACSIEIDVDVDGENEKWLLMFKNETHNHPTEIEPFGGAATCLGGAIRDPLSGRSYVYQAMRVTGAGDPRVKVEDTMYGKLPQKKISKIAAKGYSSYGNQIGLATGLVDEVYHDGFIAKRMEIGAVIAATPKDNVVRIPPVKDDVVILLGGKTGRDGCGGATGSSKSHDEKSILECGAEVQKGNPPTERKIQRLFRDKNVSNLIKKCNDFGAGGVAVAIGELAPGIDIYLDNVPKKYEGLDGTELAISESQERMAVVVDKKDVEQFINYSIKENLESTVAAKITDNNRLRMIWRDKNIVDVSRDFLDTNGVRQEIEIDVKTDLKEEKKEIDNMSFSEQTINQMKKLSNCSKKGLVEMFDSTIGAGTVIMPFGGKHQLTPQDGMVAKIPVLKGDTKTCSIMTYGYNPMIGSWSPFHGAACSVVESLAKITALGGDYRKARLTFQEYFEKLQKDKAKWGKPFSALMGAYYVQDALEVPAVGGKDSMSGTFKDINVPPTLVSFAVTTQNIDNIVSAEFKETNSKVYVIRVPKDKNDLPDLKILKNTYPIIKKAMSDGKILAASTVKTGGPLVTVSKMCLGNRIGFEFNETLDMEYLISEEYGSIVLEMNTDVDFEKEFSNAQYILLGETNATKELAYKKEVVSIDNIIEAWEKPLEKIFATKTKEDKKDIKSEIYISATSNKKSSNKFAKPRILIPVFPGTNCEYDSAKAFETAGGIVSTVIIKNLNSKLIEDTIDKIEQEINNSQIIMLPGGFSAGDEPEGSGKFIATFFRNPRISKAVMNLMNNRDGLMIGICNGFQALIKLGLLPYGEISPMKDESPTLTFNQIGRHVSCFTRTKVVSNLSPWFNNVNVGEVFSIPVSHGEGRFFADSKQVKELFNNGQVATQYVDIDGNATYDCEYNPNGSIMAIEGITSPDGRIIGKMGHSERIGEGLYINMPGNKDQKLFLSGVEYFK